MKTVLFINASSARYYRRENRIWQAIEMPAPGDKLWVIANLPEETLEVFKLPLLFGRDRSDFLERKLAAALPRSAYRAAPLISGNYFRPGQAVATGLTSAEAVTLQLDKLDVPIAGVWGMAMLLTLMVSRLAIQNVIVVQPSIHYLRILAIKQGIPVLTRCVRRYSENSNNGDNDNVFSEILRTRQHLENSHLMEGDTPLLYLGDASPISAHLIDAGLNLLPLPEALTPKGGAAYLHPLFEFVTQSPRGQLAPLLLRARNFADNLRKAAYLGIAASLLSVIVLGEEDFRTLLRLHGRGQALNADLQTASAESERLAAKISASGTDPDVVRQATRFAALEMEAAPSPATLMQFVASAIANQPQVRIKTLNFRFPFTGDRYCQGHSVIELPLVNQKIDLSPLSGSTPDTTDASAPQRFTELQFSILVTEDTPPATQIEIRKGITAALKSHSGVQLMTDPAAFSLINTLKGGIGMDSGQVENLWCMSVPWANTVKEQP